MRQIRNSCLSVEECDTPDEVRDILDDVYAILGEHRAAIESLQASHDEPAKKKPAKKGGNV